MLKISNFHLGIGVPLTFPWVPSSFFHSFIMMDRPTFTYLQVDGGSGSIDGLRNDIVEKALNIGVTNLFMCDVDQVYHPQTITKLLSHKLPIVGALVHRRYAPFDSLMLKKVVVDEKHDAYESIDEWKDGELVEVDATGGGCLMFDMEIFRNLPYPWFETKKQEGGLVIGEDIYFCQKLKAAGYKIYVDTSVPAGHLATFIVNTNLNRLYRSIKNREAADLALLNDK